MQQEEIKKEEKKELPPAPIPEEKKPEPVLEVKKEEPAPPPRISYFY